MINYGVVGVALVAYIIIGFVVTLPNPPVAPLVLGACLVIVVVAVVFFPFAKTLWSALDLVLHDFRDEDY